jgi:bifunctional DNase/RNase
MDETRGLELEVIVESVRVHMPTGRYVLLLKEVGLGRILPIWIGQPEASSIAMRLQGVTPERPLTHDLLANVIAELGARLERVTIGSLRDETFHARLLLVTPDARHEVDARPSDAIALALRLEVPIYAAAAVLDRAAALPDPDDDDDEGDDDGETPRADGGETKPTGGRPKTARREVTGEPLDIGKLEIFRDFVNSLDSEGGDQRGGSSG